MKRFPWVLYLILLSLSCHMILMVFPLSFLMLSPLRASSALAWSLKMIVALELLGWKESTPLEFPNLLLIWDMKMESLKSLKKELRSCSVIFSGSSLTKRTVLPASPCFCGTTTC